MNRVVTRRDRLEGFGLVHGGDALVARPTSPEGVAAAFDLARREGRRVVLRGAGRSYGDASVLREAVAVDVGRMRSVHGWDPAGGVLDVEAGATLEDVWRFVLEDGWFLPVTSGTMRPTLAGALAANIHGKNNPSAGTLGEWVESLDAVLPSGETIRVTPDDPRFPALVGGLGLCGAIVRVRLRLARIVSGEVDADVVRVASLEDQFAAFEEFSDAEHRVAWLDAFRGGRGVFTAALAVTNPEPSTLRPRWQDLPDHLLGLYPKSQAWRILRHLTNRSDMAALSALKYAAAGFPSPRKRVRMRLTQFHYPLDFVPGWQRAYLPGGLVQFQVCLPRETAPGVIAELLATCRAERSEPFLVVMKRHRPDRSLLPYLLDGYSVAMDFRLTPTLPALYRRLADRALDAGGRFYLAKDGLLNPDQAARSVGEGLAEFRRWKGESDPEGLLTSGLNERSRLVASVSNR